MAGLKIVFRLVDSNYHDPTTIYEVVEKENGELETRKVFSQRNIALATLVMILNHFEINRPVVLVDPHPPVLEFLRQHGIRVR